MAMLRGNQTGKDLESAALYHKIMKPAAVTASAELKDPKAPALGPVTRRKLLELDDAVCDALELHIRTFGGAIIQKNDRAALADEKLL